MQDLRFRATRKDVLAVIVFGAVRHRPKFDARDFVFFEKQAGPTSMVFLGNTPLQKRTRFLEHGRFLVITENDAMTIRYLSQGRPRALKQLSPGLSDETFGRGVVGCRFRRS